MRSIIFHHVVLMNAYLITLAEEARKTLKGMTLQQLHSKYVDLVSVESHHYIIGMLYYPFLECCMLCLCLANQTLRDALALRSICSFKNRLLYCVIPPRPSLYIGE